MKNKITFYKQLDQMDCGPTCLRIIAKYFGRSFKPQTLRDLCEINREGVSISGISKAAEKIGFSTFGGKLTIDQIKQADIPSILHWRTNHFIVLYKVHKNKFFIADPGNGLFTLNEQEFKKNWLHKENDKHGIGLLLNSTPSFYEQTDEPGAGITWAFLLNYLKQHKKSVIKLLMFIGIGSLLPLALPFLTQAVIDTGIKKKNLNFIYLILLAQIVLIISRTSVDFIRSWILLNISTRINISIITDFLIKLMKLPISFFDTKKSGDILQRLNDQKRIESFLTGSALIAIFSTLSLVLFSCLLAYYNYVIFIVFLASSVFYIFWVTFFLKERRLLDYTSFELGTQNQSSVMQLVFGMQDIKLNNGEQQKRWEWEQIQKKMFKFKLKGLALNQKQQGGATFINESKNILITFLSAKAVIDGHLTLGEMTAILFIAGQLSSPIDQIMVFTMALQDTKISLERLNEINQLEDEEPIEKQITQTLPYDKSLYLRNITFRYTGSGNKPVLSDISLNIPQGKITAIVGMSGSGKTTILKLLLRFYKLDAGEILIGNTNLDQIGFKTWRGECGAVMQDGFIFSDTIEKNITIGDVNPNALKINQALKIANLEDFISSLPMGLETVIGAEGNGISQGQRQRILIARAVYKNPQYLFFDEATNSLDAKNESIIMKNLTDFFKGKTVIIIAHRLSTVTNADNIVLLENGKIKEEGTHMELISSRGNYYNLVKAQMELN